VLEVAALILAWQTDSSSPEHIAEGGKKWFWVTQMRCWFISNRIDMEHALNELNSAGFLRAQISVVTKDADRDEQLGGAGMSVLRTKLKQEPRYGRSQVAC